MNQMLSQYGRLVSYSRPCPDITVQNFLFQQSQAGVERFYWQGGGITLAGFGMAAELMAWGKQRFDTIQEKARGLFDTSVILNPDFPLAAPRLFGGFAFSDDFMPDNTWSVFTPAHFVLPHYQYVCMENTDDARLTINIFIPPEENPHDILPELQEALDIRYEMLKNHASSIENKNPGVTPNRTRGFNPWQKAKLQTRGFNPWQLSEKQTATHPTEINYPMPYEIWEQKINQAVQDIKTTELQKVVLSRVCEIQFDNRVDIQTALNYLNQHYADCYRFLFEPRPHHLFFGATPELLVKVEGQQLHTMALAGSIKRGKTAEEDRNLAEQLLNDPKERQEHALVVEALRQRIGEIADKMDIAAEPEIYQLSNIQHLHTPIQANLKENTGVLPVVKALHPTPALGGSPRHRAMEFIQHAEPVPRGWYAAPIGWLDSQLDGMFGVAIRSAVSQHHRAWLYAGAGIVEKSMPQKEWEETALKLKPILNALGVNADV